MEKVLVTNIQKFCVHDGPGIRTTVFLKGCPLKCMWCANPETISGKRQLSMAENRCIKCSTCVDVCDNGSLTMTDAGIAIDRFTCDDCGKCSEECCTGALTVIGKEYSVEELKDEIDKDMEFYTSSGGGITFSGGEPLLQPEFLADVFTHYKSVGISTAVETSGCVPWNNIEKILPVTDVFMYDLKILDSDLHEKYCGLSNRQIISNLINLCDSRTDEQKIIIRIPLVPGITDTDDNMKETGEFLKKIEDSIEGIHCLPYHNMGTGKYDSLGMKYELEGLPLHEKEEIESKVKILTGYISDVIVGG